QPIDQQDGAVVELMALLDGHPRAMRVILQRLEQRSAANLLKELKADPAVLEAAKAQADPLPQPPPTTLTLPPQALLQQPVQTPPKGLIYIGFARGKDGVLAQEVEQQLAPLKMKCWSEGNIPPGAV